MYCRKCGHRLEEGDAFCTNCGTPVPADELVSRRMNSAAAHNPEFQWDVREEFPEPRKRETIAFNWSDGSVTPSRPETAPETPYETPTSRGFVTLENREEAPRETCEAPRETIIAQPYSAPRETHETTRDTIVAQPYSAPRETYEASRDTIVAEPSVRPTEPSVAPYNTTETEIFRDIERAEAEAGQRRDDRFYTFTMKNEEFQRLLDREYERVRRNGTPVERPLRAESPLYGYEPAEPVREPEPEPLKPVEPTPQPVYEPAPKPAYEPERRYSDTTPVTPVRPAAPAPEYRKTVSYETPTETITYTVPPEVRTEPAPAPVARPEPTFQNNPEEIRTIWEEIKADMERENAERIAKAAEAERIAKMDAERSRRVTAEPEAAKQPERSSLSAVKMAPRSTGEVAAVTATALTKIWEDDEEGADGETETKKKGHFWLIFFLIVLVILLAILAIFVVQTFWPDTPAAEFCAKAEVWLKDAWEAVSKFFTNLFK